jgi:hypothetical protein
MPLNLCVIGPYLRLLGRDQDDRVAAYEEHFGVFVNWLLEEWSVTRHDMIPDIIKVETYLEFVLVLLGARYSIYRLRHIAQNEVAVRIVCLDIAAN